MVAPDAPAGDDWYRKWLPRLVVGVVVLMTAWFGTIWVFSSISDFLITLLITFFLGFAMLPAVDWITKKWSWRRGLATAFVMFVGLLVGGVFAVAMFNVFIGQLINLINDLPELVDNVTIWLSDNVSIELDPSEFDLEFESFSDFLSGPGGGLLGGLVGFAGTALGFVFRMLTVALFLFYVLADMPRFRHAMLSRMTPERQVVADAVTRITIEKVGGYIYSRGLMAAISAVFHTVAFILIGLPYPLALGLWVGVVSQFVPTIGTYLAGVVPVVIALASGEPIDAVIVIIVITAYQQIENYLISPKVTANTMELHAAVAFGAAIVGGSLLGGIGALLALPVAATIVALVQTYTDSYEIVASEDIESVEAYEARIAAHREQKEAARAAKKAGRRWRRPKEDEPDPATVAPGDA